MKFLGYVMFRKIFITAIALSLATLVNNCSSEKEDFRPDPAESLIRYREYRDDWKLEEAYALLADSCKSFITEEEFIDYNELPDSIKQNQAFEIVSMDTLTTFGYEDFARFKVAYSYIDFNKKDTTDGIWYYSLCFEDGQWKIIWFSKMFDIAFAHLQNQRYEQARVLFQVITGIDPFNDSALRGLALSNANLNDLEGAIAAAAKMVDLIPDDPSAYALLADLKGSAQRFEESIEVYIKAIDLDPNPMYYVNLGSIYKLNEQIVEADESYRKSLELDSQLVQGWWMLGELYYYHLDDLESARKYYNKAMQLPTISDFYQQQLYYNYAQLLFNEATDDEKDIDDAVRNELLREARILVGKASNIDPLNTDYSYLTNEINIKLGNF